MLIEASSCGRSEVLCHRLALSIMYGSNAASFLPSGGGRKKGSSCSRVARKSPLKFRSVLSMTSRRCRRTALLQRLIPRYWSTPASTVSSNTTTQAGTSQFLLTRSNIARIIAFKSDHGHRLGPDFTSSLQNGGHFTNTLPSTPNFRSRIAVDRCSSTNHSRGEPMRKLTLLIILVATAAVALSQQMQMPPPKTSVPQSDAQKAFEKMKALAGTWQGSVMGIPVQTTIRVTSRGNAILHEVTSSGMPDNPITMIYVDGDRLLLTHYCDSGNRPRMEG